MTMKSYVTGFVLAGLLIAGSILPGHAEDAAPPKEPAAPAATQTEPTPPSVPRPSLVPKAAEPASPEATTDAPPSQQRFAHRHYRRYGSYRAAYWQPFPIYWPHLYRNRIHWNRIPWIIRF